MGLDFDNEWTGLSGADALIARLTALPGAAQQGAIQGMLDMAENQFMPHIKENDVPFRLGGLRSSGAVWLDESGSMVLIEFGGPGSEAEGYAVEQHERTDYNHPNGGRAKYLEAPLQEWADRFIQAAAQGVRNILTVTAGPWTRTVTVSDFTTTDMMLNAMRNHAQGFGTGAVKEVTKSAPRSSAPRLVKKGSR